MEMLRNVDEEGHSGGGEGGSSSSSISLSEMERDDKNMPALARAFVLDQSSEWVPVATGVAHTELSEEGDSLSLSLHEETNDKMILFSASFPLTQEISRQQATVVTWTGVDGADVALSFENEKGCDTFWEKVSIFMGRDPKYTSQDEQGMSVEEDEVMRMSDINEERLSIIGRPICLPEEVEFSTLPEIVLVLGQTTASPPDIRRSICISMMELSYVSKLLDLFRIAEELGSVESLHRLYSIFKSIFNINNAALLREMLSEQRLVHVAGVFEYDPLVLDLQNKSNYRAFLLDTGRFRRILDFDDVHLVDLIHQTFRVQYMKDVVLPRIMDEETFSSLTFLLRCNYAEIVESLESSDDYCRKLLPLFTAEEDADTEETVAVLKFVKEYLTIAKASGNVRHLRLYQEQFISKLIEFLRRNLLTNGQLVSEILIAVTQHDPQVVRNAIMDSQRVSKSYDMLRTLIDVVTNKGTDIGVRWQLMAVLRALLDSTGPLGIPIPNDEFLNSFYPDAALHLLKPLTDLESDPRFRPDTKDVILTSAEVDVFFNCCEVLCSFIVQHKYRIKYLLFRNFIVHNAYRLMKCQSRVLRLSAIRIVRTMIGTGDDFYFRFFTKQSLLKPLVDEAIALGDTDNALSAALLEFFFFINDHKYKILINHLVEGYRLDLQKITMAPIYEELLDCYNEINGAVGMEDSSSTDNVMEGSSQVQRGNWSSMDKSEEAYFSSATEEDDDEELESIKETEADGEDAPLMDEDTNTEPTTTTTTEELEQSKRMKC